MHSKPKDVRFVVNKCQTYELCRLTMNRWHGTYDGNQFPK